MIGFLHTCPDTVCHCFDALVGPVFWVAAPEEQDEGTIVNLDCGCLEEPALPVAPDDDDGETD